ncbi:MAG: transposon resolvase [Actinoallomurus sp.]|nr:transposon resolvase [Actinoallomurus sp.]
MTRPPAIPSRGRAVVRWLRAAGELVFHVFASLAQFERRLIQERTQAGLQAARARGRKGGRPSKMTPEKLTVAREMYASKRYTVEQIVKTVGVGRTTLYRHLEPSAATE